MFLSYSCTSHLKDDCRYSLPWNKNGNVNKVKREEKIQGTFLFFNMQKQSEGSGLSALGIWLLKRIILKVYVCNIRASFLLSPSVSLHEEKVVIMLKAADSTGIKMIFHAVQNWSVKLISTGCCWGQELAQSQWGLGCLYKKTQVSRVKYLIA